MIKRYAILVLAICLLSSVAADSESRDYSLIGADSTYSLGAQHSSNYSLRAYISTFNSTRSHVAPDIVLRESYLGLLVEPTSVEISVSPQAADEDSVITLEASINYDDGSSSDISGRGVYVQTSSGVELEGTATLLVGSVSSNEVGEISIRYLGISGAETFSIADTLPDNFGSYASDGIPDSWQINYFGTSSSLGWSTSDSDHDGQNNLFEYLAGTNPTDSASLVQVRIEQINDSRLAVILNMVVSGRIYILESSNDLVSEWSEVESKATVEDSLNFSFSEIPYTDGQVFYRVRITD